MNKKAIIIGASSGIGKELALQLLQMNYSIGISGRRQELLNDIRNMYPGSVYVSAFDVSAGNNSFYLDELISQLGGMDLCIISAGTGEFNVKLEYETELRTLSTNINGFTEIADWCYRYFRKQGNGHLVAITSVAGLRGNALAPAYNATKAYQINYLEGLRKRACEFKRNIIITDIRPGFVNTDMAKGEGIFWVASVDKAARQILKAIRKKKRIAYITRRWLLIAILLHLVPFSLYKHL